MNDDKFEYDVVFSLAGEQKTYAESVAKYLRDQDIKVWFYKFNELDLWGKNQIDVFSQIFTKSAKYCVVFISKEYTEKVWPNLERQFIQSRWLKDPDYLLPARFDDSLIIGIPDTVAYINLQNRLPEEFGEMVIRKINQSNRDSAVPAPSFRKPVVKQFFDPFEVRNHWIFSIFSGIKKRSEAIPEMAISQDEVDGAKILRLKFRDETIYSLNIYKRAHTTGDEGISFYGTEGEIRQAGSASNAFGSFIWSKEKNCVVLKLFDLSLFDILPGTERAFTEEEFVNTLWDKICNIIEKNY